MATIVSARPRVVARQSAQPLRLATVLPWALLLTIFVLVFYPLGMVVFSSFRNQPPGSPGDFTMAAWVRVFSSSDVLGPLWNTVRIVLPKVVVAISVAASFAWVLARTNVPFKRALEGLLAFMFFIPTLPWVISWTLLISPKSGIINQFLAPILPGDFRFNAYSYEALVILGAMNSVPILFLLLYPAFRNIDPSLEESAQASGASRFTILRYVTLPLLAPAILAAGALSIVVGMESFEVEQLLGVPAGIFVFTTRIYDFLYSNERPQFASASALSMFLLTFTVLLIVLQRRVLARRSFVTVTGKGYRSRTVDARGWRWLLFAYVAGYVVVFGILPFVILLINSFMQVSGFIGFEMFSTRGWDKVLNSPQIASSIQNTIVVAASTATLGIVVASLASYTITRLRWKGRAWMDLMVWLPIAIPGIVLALGFLWAFVALPIYGTIWVLVLAYLIRGLPTSSRFFTSTMIQIGPELEEAARVHGVRWTKVFLHVWRPILQPAAISAWIYLFVISVRTLDSALLLTGPKSEVLSVSIFQQASRGDNVVGSALAIIQVGILILAFLATRLIEWRARTVRRSQQRAAA